MAGATYSSTNSALASRPDPRGGAAGGGRSRRRAGDRVLAAVECVRLYGRGAVLLDELGPCVARERVGGAYPERLVPHVVGRLPLPEVEVERVGDGALLLQPLHADRSVQSARVREHHLLAF